MGLVKVWDKEIKGKLYAVGDIHGCYNLLMNRLKEIGFDFDNDLLVAVGDLVDRGTQNLECI
ncbi:metallophosphoesterase, partial [Acinetobacter baumannii]